MKTHQFLYPVVIAAVAALAIFGAGCKEDKKEVAGVSLSPKSLSMAIAGEQNLTASVIPSDAENKSVSWLSRNNDIATVDAGVVKGIAAGETYVVVATEEGNFRDSCRVIVAEEEPVVKKLLPARITEVGKDYSMTYNYTYDDQNRLIEVMEYENEEYAQEFTFIYKDTGEVDRIEKGEKRFPIRFYYNGLYVREYIESILGYTHYDYYELNNQGQCICKYYSTVSPSKRIVAITYDAQGNYAVMDFVKNMREYSEQMAYDNKNGIFSQMNTPTWFSIMWERIGERFFLYQVNNVTSHVRDSCEEIFSYVYNEDDYPVEMTVTVNSVEDGTNYVRYSIEYIEAK